MAENNKLPTLKDLVTDVGTYKKQDKLNFLLNQEPPKKWIKKHPFISKTVLNEQGQKIRLPYEYLPIDKVEYLMRKIFKFYKIEILREGQLFNAVYTSVRVHYKDITTGEWMFHDGLGASQLQTKKSTSPSDLANLNNGAVMMALPLSKTLAIKDACDMFGNLFGANLNREDSLGATLDSTLKNDDEKEEAIKNLLETDGLIITEEERMNINRILEQKEKLSYDKAIRLLKNAIPKNNGSN